MKRYSQEQKNELIRRMQPPNNEDVVSLSEETGIPVETLRTWKYRPGKAGIPMDDEHSSGIAKIIRSSMNSADKFQIVLETYAMTETELGEYARQRGLYVEEIKAWREGCKNANGGTSANEQRLNQELKTQQQENKELKREITRKDKTIAEVTALLVLSKKAQAIWGESEDV